MLGYARIPNMKNITSDNICFYPDGNLFLAGCSESILVEGRLSNYKKSETDRKLSLSGHIKNLKMDKKDNEGGHAYVNCLDYIYKVKLKDLKTISCKFKARSSDQFEQF